MGYYSRISGGISFDLPATHLEVKEIEERSSNLIALEIETEKEDTPDGLLTRRWADNIYCPADGEQVKAYTLDEDLQRVMDILRRNKERTFEGSFLVIGEESTDIWRLRVTDPKGIITKEQPKLVWPNGEEEVTGR